MKITYENSSISAIEVNVAELKWTKATTNDLAIDWNYLEKHHTTFRLEVWKEIAKIKWGETRSYKDIAIAIGSPNSYRAVANACGANPLLLLIPCHRVVGTNDLGGYVLGIDVKKRLLKLEAE